MPNAVGQDPIGGADREAERRLLTVMFCDLVNSTPLAERMDPEAFRDLLLDFQRTAAGVCERYEGHVGQRLGDGLLIYFGYPAAHDDDAERAARCACDLVAALARLRHTPPLVARIGLHTGLVVVGQMGEGAEVTVTGATAHLAARLQSMAEPGTILVSDATFRLVPGLFVTRDLGERELKGLSVAVRVHQVLQPSGVRSRLEAAARVTPFVGRESELGLLTARWHDALAGRGQAVLLSGEPGLGKSRLLMTFGARIDRAHSWLECRASPLTRNSAFAPIVELLQRGLSIREADSAEDRLARIEQGLESIGLDQGESIPLLAPLMALDLPAHYPPAQLGPELKRRRTLELLVRWVQALAAQQVLVIVCEDLHWADASTLDCLGQLLQELETQPVLLLMTARPEFTPPWPVRACWSLVTLRPLPEAQAGQMVDALTDGRALAPAVHGQLIERAGGVPLFLEELTKALLESGQLVQRDGLLQSADPSGALLIPQSLQGSLMARLDRLGAARNVLQEASVIGREVSYRLLALVSRHDAAALEGYLQQLTDAQLLHARGTLPEATYVFKHALIQDAAYEALLKSTRQRLHGAIVAALEAHFPERTRTEPEVLATHCEQARMHERAVHYYRSAAELAMAGSSASEAIRLVERALSLLPDVADEPTRRNLEVGLLVRLGLARLTLLGFGHPDVDPIVQRLRERHSDVDDVDLAARALSLTILMALGSSQFDMYRQAGERFVELGAATGRSLHRGLGHRTLAMWHYFAGDLATSSANYALALSAYDEAGSREEIGLLAGDGICMALVGDSVIDCLMGYLDRAVGKTAAATERAGRLDHPATTSCVAAMAVWTLVLRRESAEAIRRARAVADHADRHGVVEWQGLALLYLAVARCMSGDDAALPMLRSIQDARHARRSTWGEPWYRCIEAQTCLRTGRLAQARAALDAAVRHQDRFGELSGEAEVARVLGELALAEGSSALAERRFLEAMEIARRRQARLLELRAATRLAQLWQRQRRAAAARDLLGPVHGGFTEGLGLPDLVEAASLLAELG